ncbi:hypothetical protein, partial [Thermococcus sp. 21S9]|uniref:hypothetical protein n=1 Tax=Thermococcus sp. 21S9 TaxID=1638223 RepID=UPI001980BC0D
LIPDPNHPVSFQFSSSLIATMSSRKKKEKKPELSILLESYCNGMALGLRPFRLSFQFSSSLIATLEGAVDLNEA